MVISLCVYLQSCFLLGFCRAYAYRPAHRSGSRANLETRRNTLNWLRTEFAIETPGQKLEAFAALDEAAFVEEVRKRRPKAAGKLTPGALRALREGYAEQATPVQQRQAEALQLERRLADLVN